MSIKEFKCIECGAREVFPYIEGSGLPYIESAQRLNVDLSSEFSRAILYLVVPFLATASRPFVFILCNGEYRRVFCEDCYTRRVNSKRLDMTLRDVVAGYRSDFAGLNKGDYVVGRYRRHFFLGVLDNQGEVGISFLETNFDGGFNATTYGKQDVDVVKVSPDLRAALYTIQLEFEPQLKKIVDEELREKLCDIVSPIRFEDVVAAILYKEFDYAES